MKRIKYTAFALIIATLVLLAGCKKNNPDDKTSASSDFSSGSVTTVPDRLHGGSSQTENGTQGSAGDNSDGTSSGDSSIKPEPNYEPIPEIVIPPQPDEPQADPQPEPQAKVQTPAEKMAGTYSCTYLPGTLPVGGRFGRNNVYVFDITIGSDENVIISEKEYYPSDTADYGAEAYFDGKRYILINDSANMCEQSAFKGHFATEAGKENVAEINIRDYEPFTGQFFVNETHFLTLTDASHLQWTSCESESGGLYFPFNTSTVFTKK